MLKKMIFICVFCSVSITVNAQAFVEKTYTYDSILNITYGVSENFNHGLDTLSLDIYKPVCSDTTVQRPLIIFIHGGAFLAGSKSDLSITRLCKEFAKRGYVTASINYRLGMVSDNKAWSCNYPNYSCIFTTDSAEWIRAAYRGIQDAKGALRFLVKHAQVHKIDPHNVFVAGESTGGFIALGVATLDTISEKFPQAFQLNAVPKPHSTAQNCDYNLKHRFDSDSIQRPDLGSIEGDIEVGAYNYTIKGVANVFGGMNANLLHHIPSGKVKPAIYLFHQPCDLVVPFDSGVIFKDLSWCFTNGYGCNAIQNTPKIYGSKAIADWNTTFQYGYPMQTDFTQTAFPNSYIIGNGSCLDQVNKPCHAYDNFSFREDRIARFFAQYNDADTSCLLQSSMRNSLVFNSVASLKLFPNPVLTNLNIVFGYQNLWHITLYDAMGNILFEKQGDAQTSQIEVNVQAFATGVYFVKLKTEKKTEIARFLKA
jgi:hypothetical protein